jgi:hypothetical protein
LLPMMAPARAPKAPLEPAGRCAMVEA